ncbi:MAG: ATP-dependent DNA helicase RecG [Gammaproteobacteria bacterium]|nr:ATP-dependent DNA helicase RecG [Gammaproteobacteria bacterium]
MTTALLEQTGSFDNTPCRMLKGVGPALFERLQRCGIETLQDLLFHLPLRYQDRTRLATIAQLQVGDTAWVEGAVVNVEIKVKPRRTLLCQLQDGSGVLTLRFFHFSEFHRAKLMVGARIRAFGEVRGYGLKKELIHPDYQVVTMEEPVVVEDQLTPVYPTTSGLSQRVLNQLTDQVLALLRQGALLKEYLPIEVLTHFRLCALSEALAYVHRPPREANTATLLMGKHPMQQRLAFEELLAHHLSLKKNREKINCFVSPAFKPSQVLLPTFLKKLGFALTRAQQRVCEEVSRDLQGSKPMLRLVQGDVGSGKTAVCAIAALQAIENGYQVALMAPTELLAEQHRHNFTRWFADLGVEVLFLSGKQKGKSREQVLQRIATEKNAIVIGTHALFQEDVSFACLGLVIVDEQHRFGVQQRLALRDKAKQCPHQLVMSATPIPRTLAMVAYADLDQSIIDELPPGRMPVKTAVLPQLRREEIVLRIREQCRAKHQAYWICTLIEESETLQCQTATDTYLALRCALPELRLGLVHGRLSGQEKQEIMDAFRLGTLDLLVATTVIEVGVDVPNASLMVIENAERLGLAQLHQLRGRVGRGANASYCVLLYQAPLSFLAKARLKAMRDTQDGFVIAEHDLALRGPGELLGTRQTGLVQFRVADMVRDKTLIPQVQAAAERIDPNQAECLIRRWLGQGERYARV